MVTSETYSPPPPPAKTVSLWAGVLGAPFLWSLQMQIGFALVPWICGHGMLWLLHLLTVIFLAGTIACGVLCWREYTALNVHGHADEAGAVGRTHFLSLLGVWSCAFFAMVILAQGIASFFLNPCWD